MKVKTCSVYNGDIVKKITSGQIVTCDMSPLADCMAQNLFLVSIMSLSLFFDKYLKLPKTIVKHYLPKVGHGIMILDPTIYDTSKLV